MSATLGACQRHEAVVVGESTKVRLQEPMPRHATYDEVAGATAIHAARGETVGIQLRLPEPVNVSLSFASSPLVVTAYEVKSQSVREPSTTLYGRHESSRGAGDYPDILVPSATPDRVVERAHVYFDIAVPAGTAPGTYEGLLEAGPDRRKVRVHVVAVTVELEKDPLVWVFYHPKEIARAHGVADDNGPAQLEWEERYRKIFRAHGAYLLADLPPDRYPARRHFYEGLRYVPVAVRLDDEQKLGDDVRAWQRLLDGTSAVPFAIPVDEPQTEKDRLRAIKMANLIHERQDADASVRIRAAVTAPFREDFADHFDIYFAPTQIPQVAACRQSSTKALFFPYNGHPPLAGSMVIDTDGVALRTWGWIAFRFGVDLWYAWEGLYFHDRYNRGQPLDLLTNPITFDERRKYADNVGAVRERSLSGQPLPSGADHGNGDGLLVYPGGWPSLRLKALRRGLLDRLLLLRLAACGHEALAQQMAQKVVPRALGEAAGLGSWPRAEWSWERARRALLEQNHALCPDPAPSGPPVPPIPKEPTHLP